LVRGTINPIFNKHFVPLTKGDSREAAGGQGLSHFYHGLLGHLGGGSGWTDPCGFGRAVPFDGAGALPYRESLRILAQPAVPEGGSIWVFALE